MTTVPARIRRELGIEEGDFLIWEVDREREVINVRVVKNPLKHLKGKYNDPRLSYEIVEGIADSLLEARARAGFPALFLPALTRQSSLQRAHGGATLHRPRADSLPVSFSPLGASGARTGGGAAPLGASPPTRAWPSSRASEPLSSRSSGSCSFRSGCFGSSKPFECCRLLFKSIVGSF